MKHEKKGRGGCYFVSAPHVSLGRGVPPERFVSRLFRTMETAPTARTPPPAALPPAARRGGGMSPIDWGPRVSNARITGRNASVCFGNPAILRKETRVVRFRFPRNESAGNRPPRTPASPWAAPAPRRRGTHGAESNRSIPRHVRNQTGPFRPMGEKGNRQERDGKLRPDL